MTPDFAKGRAEFTMNDQERVGTMAQSSAERFIRGRQRDNNAMQWRRGTLLIWDPDEVETHFEQLKNGLSFSSRVRFAGEVGSGQRHRPAGAVLWIRNRTVGASDSGLDRGSGDRCGDRGAGCSRNRRLVDVPSGAGVRRSYWMEDGNAVRLRGNVG